MAYETGVSTSPSNLLSKIENHANTNGWSIVRNNGSPGAQLSISDGSAAEGNQFNFLADDTAATAHIRGQPSRADAGAGAAFYAHTGSPNTSGSVGTYVVCGHRGSATDQGFSGSHVAYHIFSGSTADGRYMHVVVEGTAGVFWHLAWGTLEKAGTYDGGQYMTGLNLQDDGDVMWPFQCANPTAIATQWIRCDDFFTSIGQTTDAGVSRWFEDIGNAHNQGQASGLSAAWYQGGLIAYNQRSPFGPNLLYAWNATGPIPTTTAFKILGHTPDLRLVSMDGREPGSTVTIGSDTWHIFPVHRKTTDGVSTTTSAYINTWAAGGAPNNDSNLAGFAYLQVP